MDLGRVEILRGDSERARGHVAQAVGLIRPHDRSRVAIWVLEVCAEIAAGENKAEHAMRLIGVVDVMRVAAGAHQLTPERYDRERWEAAARAALGEERANMAYKAGQAMTIDEALAYALSDEQGPQATPSATPLTTREAEVLRLIASGCTNSGIAEELVLSVRTVERHIANIYAQIGARGCADATAYALRHGVSDLVIAAT